MKRYAFMMAMLLSGSIAFAQTSDPVIMTIAGQPVSRSEFEYSYNKNNSEGVIDKKSVDQYVDLFVNYKLKVKAALDANLDTLNSFAQEFKSYRDQQIRPTMINDADVEAEAQKIYQETRKRIDDGGGMVKVAHILVLLKQKASDAEQKAAQEKIDSIYKVLKHGGDFAELAKKYSQDPGSAKNGGDLGSWITRNQTVKAFEDAAYGLKKKGQYTKPIQSEFC